MTSELKAQLSQSIEDFLSKGYVILKASELAKSFDDGYDEGYRCGMEHGNEEGFIGGRSLGLSEGTLAGYSEGFAQAEGEELQAFNEGHEMGYENGKADMADQCAKEKSEAYTEGLSDGHAHGYEMGYTKAKTDMSADCAKQTAEAYAEGRSDGHAEAYAEGFEACKADMSHTIEMMQVAFADGRQIGKREGEDEGQAKARTAALLEAEEKMSERLYAAFSRGYDAGKIDSKGGVKKRKSHFKNFLPHYLFEKERVYIVDLDGREVSGKHVKNRVFYGGKLLKLEEFVRTTFGDRKRSFVRDPWSMVYVKDKRGRVIHLSDLPTVSGQYHNDL